MANSVDLKCVLLGRAGAGKTCLVTRFLHDQYKDNYSSTVGAAFGSRSITIGKKTVKIGVWDTAGSERYESMTKIYYQKAGGAIVCYDVTDAESFEKVKFWVKQLHTVEQNVTIAVVATKVDLIEKGKPRAVPFSVAKKYASSINAEYFETSAKTAKSVNEPFLYVASQFASKPREVNMYEPTTLSLSSRSPAEKKSNCC